MGLLRKVAFVGIAKKLYDESRKPENQRRINDATPYVDPGCPTRPAVTRSSPPSPVPARSNPYVSGSC